MVRPPVPISADDILEIQLAKAFILNKDLYAPVFARFGIETYEFHVLLRLTTEDGLPQVELGRLTLRGKVAISRLVDEIEARGLVVRRPDSTDTRIKRVWLTPKARRLVPLALAAYADIARQAHRALSPRKRVQLMGLLSDLQRGYREALENIAERRTA